MSEKNASCTTDMSLPLFLKKKNPIFFLFFKICSPRIGLKVVIPDSGQLFYFFFSNLLTPWACPTVLLPNNPRTDDETVEGGTSLTT